MISRTLTWHRCVDSAATACPARYTARNAATCLARLERTCSSGQAPPTADSRLVLPKSASMTKTTCRVEWFQRTKHVHDIAEQTGRIAIGHIKHETSGVNNIINASEVLRYWSQRIQRSKRQVLRHICLLGEVSRGDVEAVQLPGRGCSLC